MKKSFFAVFLAAVLLLCGCVPSNLNPGATTQGTQPTTGTVTEPTEDRGPYPEGREDIFCQRLPEQVDAPEGVTVLKWLVLSGSDHGIAYPFGNGYDWSESAARELNDLAQRLNLPFRIQFVLFSTTCVTGLDWFRVPEVLAAMAESDLITTTFQLEQMPQYLLPLTDYTDSGLKNTVAHPAAWSSATWGKEIYGIPCHIRYPVTNGWVVAEELASESGLGQFQRGREFWEMGWIFAQIYEANGGEGFLMPRSNSASIRRYNGIVTQLPTDLNFLVENRFSCIGACFAIDYSGDKPAVVNLLRTEYVRETLQAMQLYAEKGYYAKSAKDALLDYSYCYSNAVAAQEISGQTWYRIPNEQLVYQTGGDPMLTGILRGSGNVSAALAMLEQLGENEAFRKQLLWGTEGKHFTLEDGEHVALNGEDGRYDMTFLSPMGRFDLEEWTDFDALLPVEEGKDRLEVYRETVNACTVRPVIPFDYSTVMKETEEIVKIMGGYKYTLAGLGQEQYENMLQSIRSAGEEYVIAELQRQLEAWLEANPWALGK